jgi:flagellar export protein FliJ
LEGDWETGPQAGHARYLRAGGLASDQRRRTLNPTVRRTITAAIMRRFNFTLEPVLALREEAERQAMEQLAVELVQQEALTDAARRASARLSDAHAGCADATGVDLVARQAFLERLELEVEASQDRVRAQEDRVAAQQLRVEASARDREALERLKTERRSEHGRAAARAEQADLLDLVTARAGREAA